MDVLSLNFLPFFSTFQHRHEFCQLGLADRMITSNERIIQAGCLFLSLHKIFDLFVSLSSMKEICHLMSLRNIFNEAKSFILICLSSGPYEDISSPVYRNILSTTTLLDFRLLSGTIKKIELNVFCRKTQ